MKTIRMRLILVYSSITIVTLMVIAFLLNSSIDQLFEQYAKERQKSQIEYILNQDIKTLKDEGVSSDLMENVSHRKNGGYTLSLLKDKDIDEKDKLLDDDAYYFDIDLKDYDTKLVVGIPKDKNDHRISANIYADKITWSFTGEYEIKTVEDIKMPEATVSDKTIDVLKSLYSSYLEIIKKS